MIQKHISLMTRKLVFCQFVTQKYEDSKSAIQGIFVKNDNLRFQDERTELYLSPMYPQLIHKGKNMFSINSEGIVLYFKFVPKVGDGKNDEERKKQERYFSFKYSHLAALVGIEPNSGLSMLLARPKMESLQVKDDPQNKQVLFLLRKLSTLDQALIVKSPVNFKFSCNYMQYRIMQIILKKSLFDLSGMALVHEARRLEQLNQLQNSQAGAKKKIQIQIDQFYK